jgi:hypothetical protein
MIGVRRDKDVIFSREKDGLFERYVDQMQDPVEGRVTSEIARDGETIGFVLTGGISVLMFLG